MAELVAYTWNENEVGRLWTREWYHDPEKDRWFVLLICSGVFTQPVEFADQDEFWTRYDDEAKEFNGRMHVVRASPTHEVRDID